MTAVVECDVAAHFFACAARFLADLGERTAEYGLIAHDESEAEVGFRSKVVMKARLRDGQLLRYVRVAEAVEASGLGEPFGDVENALRGRRQWCLGQGNPFVGLDFYLLVSIN